MTSYYMILCFLLCAILCNRAGNRNFEKGNFSAILEKYSMFRTPDLNYENKSSPGFEK